jgi:hypothetical protein
MMVEKVVNKASGRKLKHHIVMASCLGLAVSLGALSVFDLTRLVEVPGTLDKALKFQPEERSVRLPGSLEYVNWGISSPEKKAPLLRVQDRRTGKQGFVDSQGTPVIPCRFESTCEFKDGLARAAIDSGDSQKWGVINERGEWVVQPKYPAVDELVGDVLSVRLDDGRGALVDRSGKVIWQSQSKNDAPSKIGSMFRISNGNLSGLINAKGEILLPCDYTNILTLPIERSRYGVLGFSYAHGLFNETYFVFGKSGRCGLVSASGRILFEPKFTQIVSAENNGVVFQDRTKYGVADLSGNILIEPKYDYITAFDKVMAAKIGHKWILLDDSGKPIDGATAINGVDVAPGMPWFSDGRGLVLVGDKIGFVDEKGKLAIQPNFEWAERFHDGYAAVWDGGTYKHFINTSGLAVGPNCVSIGSFRDGAANVHVPGILSFIKDRHLDEALKSVKLQKAQIAAARNY